MEVEVLSRLLDQELEKEEEALALPPLVPTLSIRLIPLRKAPPTRDALPLNGSAPSRLVTPPHPPLPQNQPEPTRATWKEPGSRLCPPAPPTGPCWHCTVTALLCSDCLSTSSHSL